MEDEKTQETVYREALRTLWDLQMVMPIECNPDYPEWRAKWDAQHAATETTRNELVRYYAKKTGDGFATVARIIQNEYEQWRQER